MCCLCCGDVMLPQLFNSYLASTGRYTKKYLAEAAPPPQRAARIVLIKAMWQSDCYHRYSFIPISIVCQISVVKKGRNLIRNSVFPYY